MRAVALATDRVGWIELNLRRGGGGDGVAGRLVRLEGRSAELDRAVYAKVAAAGRA
jgi:hypothetical protein